MRHEADPATIEAGHIEPLIRCINVQGLFGRYSYTLPRPEIDARPSRLMLLHGDNGSGKTTVLRTLWHLLSPADNRGHRGALAKTPFRVFRVELAGDSVIEVIKTEGLLGPFDIRIATPEDDFTGHHPVDRDLDVIASPGSIEFRALAGVRATYAQYLDHLTDFQSQDDGQLRVLQFIRSLGAAPYMLADDRNLRSDEIDRERERDKLETQWHEMSTNVDGSRTTFSVSAEVALALRQVNSWFRELTLGAQSVGSEGAQGIYTNVLRELAYGDPELPRESSSKNIEALLTEVAERSPGFAEFGLTPTFDDRMFLTLLKHVPPERKSLAANIIFPYLDSLKTRYTALEEAERLIRLLVTHANQFLVDKELTFAPRPGLQIVTDDGAIISPNQLSSGERQLILLLCTTLLASRSSPLFIVDEPELSLSVSWQRRVISSLLACTSGTPLQFLVATHSIEMVTGNRRSLVRLSRNNDAR